ncbi:MAG: TIGR04066 family peptide maturation system protein [Caldicoprobacteraceae bacterium]|jgi:peptide maturation system protein (TIGR04066 family)
MKKLMIYPFNKEVCPIARFKHLLEGYEFISAVPSKGFGWERRDACELDGGSTTDVMLGESFLDELELCDAVLLNYGQHISEKENAKYEAYIRDSGKELISFDPVSILDGKEDIYPDILLKEIPVPVVMIMGLGENCQKFEIQLGLREVFQREGYRVSQFGTKAYSSLFGFNMLPSVPEVPLWKKIYLYNRLFSEVYEREKPDVIIAGVPGGIMPINSFKYEFFGETALALTSAARPDFTLLSFYFEHPTDEYFELLRQYVRFRLGVGQVYFHASNTRYIVEESLKQLSYLTLQSRFVLDKIKQYGLDMSSNLFNALIPESYEPVYQSVIEKLQQNIRVL